MFRQLQTVSNRKQGSRHSQHYVLCNLLIWVHQEHSNALTCKQLKLEAVLQGACRDGVQGVARQRVPVARLGNLGRQHLATQAQLDEVALRVALDGIRVPGGQQLSARLGITAAQGQAQALASAASRAV